MSLQIRRNSCLRHTTGIFFVLLSALASVNFDVCSIDFVMFLLNGVPFSIFVLIFVSNRLLILHPTRGVTLSRKDFKAEAE